MENYFRNKSGLQLILKWKYTLLIISFAVALVAYILSGPKFITPKFKSDATLYPINIQRYSDESVTEQMLQVIGSNDIRERVINEFNLAAHYEIDSSEKHFETVLFKEYSSNISFDKTEFDAVVIEVMDKDPKMAKHIVDSIIVYYNDMINNLNTKKNLEFAKIKNYEMKKKQSEIDTLESKLIRLYKKIGGQTIQNVDYIVNGYVQSYSKIGENNDEISALQFQLIKEREVYSDLKKRYDEAMESANRYVSYSQIISKPIVADKKSYPIRWIIVLFSVISVFFGTLIAIGIIESIKNNKSK